MLFLHSANKEAAVDSGLPWINFKKLKTEGIKNKEQDTGQTLHLVLTDNCISTDRGAVKKPKISNWVTFTKKNVSDWQKVKTE